MRAPYDTPSSVAMALRNAFMQIRACEFERGQAMSDHEQLQIAADHVADFLGGKAFVAEWRHEAIRAFITAVCADAACIDELERAMSERRAA